MPPKAGPGLAALGDHKKRSARSATGVGGDRNARRIAHRRLRQSAVRAPPSWSTRSLPTALGFGEQRHNPTLVPSHPNPRRQLRYWSDHEQARLLGPDRGGQGGCGVDYVDGQDGRPRQATALSSRTRATAMAVNQRCIGLRPSFRNLRTRAISRAGWLIPTKARCSRSTYARSSKVRRKNAPMRAKSSIPLVCAGAASHICCHDPRVSRERKRVACQSRVGGSAGRCRKAHLPQSASHLPPRRAAALRSARRRKDCLARAIPTGS